MSHKAQTPCSIAVTSRPWWNCSAEPTKSSNDRSGRNGADTIRRGWLWTAMDVSLSCRRWRQICGHHGVPRLFGPGRRCGVDHCHDSKFKAVFAEHGQEQNQSGIRKRVGAKMRGFRTRTCRPPSSRNSTSCTGRPASNDSTGTLMTMENGEHFGMPKMACIKQGSPITRCINGCRCDHGSPCATEGTLDV